MSFLVSVLRPLAYISLPLFLLRSVAASSPLGRYYVRAAMYVSMMLSVATCSTAVAAGMVLLGRRYDTNFVVARMFYALCKRVMNIRVEVVEGEEYLSTRPAVYMMNHQSMLDILIVGRLMPKQTSIMSKKSLQFTPLGPFMTLSGAIFIDRGKNTQAVSSLEAAGQLMKRLGTSLWMFPEGTRHNKEVPDMLPLKKGGFHLAVQSGIPIVPIVAENYWRMYHYGVFEEGRVKVRVLPPVSTTGLKAQDVSDLAVRVRNLMVEALCDISAKAATGQPKKETKVEKHLSPLQPEKVAPQLSGAQLPQKISAVEGNVGSSASLTMSSSTSSLHTWQSGASEYGAETEEDEGMILVGRPA
ncbi:hypothetical protein AX14_008529 [Amanita brunnescens Koide BX004]|nr:hypothetical protein AX14_008529 [Amanita brunnescens Koide BX004]